MSRIADLKEALAESEEARSWKCTSCDKFVETEGNECSACAQYTQDIANGLFDDDDYEDSIDGMWDGEDDGDDIDIDVCLGCGRYYGMSPSLQQAWHESVNYREGSAMDQLCLRCMTGHPPPHEY